MKNSIKLKGRVKVRIIDRDGSVIDETPWIKNTITNASLAEVSGLVGNVGSKTAFRYMAVGTDNTTPAASQTELVSEITDSGLARAAVTPTQETDAQTDDTLELDHTWTATGSKTVEEVGVFNASSDGTMLCRALTGSKSLTSGQGLNVVYQITFS